jgi:hypothetical protein
LILHDNFYKIYIYSYSDGGDVTLNNICIRTIRCRLTFVLIKRVTNDIPIGIACRDDLLEVFILTIGKVTSLAHKRLNATIVEIDEIYP